MVLYESENENKHMKYKFAAYYILVWTLWRMQEAWDTVKELHCYIQHIKSISWYCINLFPDGREPVCHHDGCPAWRMTSIQIKLAMH